MKLKNSLGKINYEIVNNGYFYSDGGAAFGVLPHFFWSKKYTSDKKNRVKMNLNLLLIKSENKNILIDTGIGNKLSSKELKIYNTENTDIIETLSKRDISNLEIDYVILTHLHFDHAGGIIYKNEDNEPKLSFPNAKHIIQKKEWEIAKNPDLLNKAAYNFEDNLKLLENSDNLLLIDGDFDVTSEVKIIFTGGHSHGMQSVRLNSEDKIAYYAGDIIPSEPHLNLPVTSAYDINRQETFLSKKLIIEDLKKNNGIIFLNHDPNKTTIKF